MSTFTPGPWTHDSNTTDLITADSDGEPVCEIARREWTGGTDDALSEEEAANAALIAAAPDLLEACRQCFERLTDNDMIALGSHPLTQILAHAIAQAEGRA